MRLGIRTKLFLISLGLIVLSIGVVYAYLRPALDRVLTDRIQADMQVRVALVAQAVAARGLGPDPSEACAQLCVELAHKSQARVTLLTEDGMLLADSEIAPEQIKRLPSHRDRPEVQGALTRGVGVSARDSATLHQRMMYVAMPLSLGEPGAGRRGVVRLAVPLDAVDRAMTQLHVALGFGAAAALGLAVLMSSIAAHFAVRSLRLVTQAARRMVQGELTAVAQLAGDDEVAHLGRDLHTLAQSLSAALRQLVEERDRLNGVLLGMREGVLVVERSSGRVALVNPALSEMLLLTGDASGRATSELWARASGCEELSALLGRAAAEPGARPALEEVRIGGLKPRRLLVQTACIGEKKGELLAVLVDVTELRRLESLRRDFVANASHELRTPVTSIRSAAETLRDVLPRDPVASVRFLDIVERNAERLQQIVADLLELSRIESHQLRLEKTAVPLGEAVAHVLFLFSGSAADKGIRLVSEVGDERALCDRRALEQALGNLVDNALKYCPRGARVTVRAEGLSHGPEGQPGAWVRIAVADTGPGIAAEHLPRLFERFYRVDAGRSRALGGTGLGLAIVKHMVEAMGGEVAVDSREDTGSTFALVLPAPPPAS